MPSPSQKTPSECRFISAAVASFVVTVALAHVATLLALPAIASQLERRMSAVAGGDLDLGVPPARPRRLAVIGTSLSRSGRTKETLAAVLRRRLVLAHSQVVNRSGNGFQMGDLFARAIRESRDGTRVLLVELNPFVWNERRYLFQSKEDKVVTLEAADAVAIFPHVRGSVRLQIIRQLGLDDALAYLAGCFAPARFRQGGLLQFALGAAGRRALPSAPRVRTDAEARERHEQLRTLTCNNFSRKRFDGVDLEVLDDLLDWANREQTRLVFYFPPLNTAWLAGCGGDTLARSNGLVAELRQRVVEHGFQVVDMSHLLDGRVELFDDYGHLVRAGSIDLWAGPLVDELRRLAVAQAALGAK
ncbi:MAG: hypothetical protein ABSA52_00655 [Candidatus Binatia bacterium]|jgi:hypothetical protein